MLIMLNTATYHEKQHLTVGQVEAGRKAVLWIGIHNGSVCFRASLIRVRIRPYLYGSGSGSGSGSFHQQVKSKEKLGSSIFFTSF
jgi:hypothetical protein